MYLYINSVIIEKNVYYRSSFVINRQWYTKLINATELKAFITFGLSWKTAEINRVFESCIFSIFLYFHVFQEYNKIFEICSYHCSWNKSVVQYCKYFVCLISIIIQLTYKYNKHGTHVKTEILSSTNKNKFFYSYSSFRGNP